ncbi:MAG: MinD/ParA family protein [Proteobacteria bacterium]|nr:MinD/ParA family protein [Pseudomonadota bacterium]
MTQAPLPKPKDAARTKARNFIAVASGKGGVGKTWLSVTLSHALAQAERKTLLFDGDLGLANLDIQLGLMPKHDLGGVFSGRHSLAQAVSLCEETGFDFIAGRSGSGALSSLPANRVQALVDELILLGANYDHVILDLGAGIEHTVRRLAYTAPRIIVVVTDEPTSLTDGYAFIKVAHSERPDIRIDVVTNMMNSTREGERTFNTLSKACEGFLKFSPMHLGNIRRDDKVRAAIREQSPLLNLYPECFAAEDVRQIVRDLNK